jgi:hypothetical protein
MEQKTFKNDGKKRKILVLKSWSKNSFKFKTETKREKLAKLGSVWFCLSQDFLALVTNKMVQRSKTTGMLHKKQIVERLLVRTNVK